jgi:hypothetical protein
MSEWVLKTLQKFGDFQAEYEGSIPFTRSNVFNRFRHYQFSIRTSMLLLIRTNVRLLFAARAVSWCR